jgi:hypothetical protein
MFARQSFSNPFQLGQLGQSGPLGWGGINPLAAHMAGFGVNPYAGINPLLGQTPGFGVHPYGVSPFSGINPVAGINPYLTGAGINPYLTGQLGAPQALNPVGAQLAATNPALLPYLAQQAGVGGYAFSVPSPFGASGIGPQVNPFGVGLGQQLGGLSPFAQWSQGGVHPQMLAQHPALAAACDPMTAALLAQSANPLAQQQLPIRPLINAQQQEPFQTGFSPWTAQAGYPVSPWGVAGVEPYAQFQGISPLTGINPYHHLLRAYSGAPWGV